MSAPLTCGPFAATESEGKAYVIFHVNTQGDWIGTDEGRDKLEAAQQAIAAACDRQLLPADTEFEYRGNDSAIVRVPFEGWAEAMKAGPVIKELIPSITGAVVTDMTRHVS